MISTMFYANCVFCIRKANPLSVRDSTISTVVECVALAVLGGCVGYFFHAHYASYIGIGACGVGIITSLGLFCFVNRQNLFFGGYPKQKRLDIDKSKYGVETVPLTIDGEQHYFYGSFLNPTYLEWKKVENELTFQDFIDRKIGADMTFKAKLMENKLRLLTPEERSQVQVHFDFDNGRLLQVGLDNDQEAPTQMPEGEYIFVLHKVEGKKLLYMAKKGPTAKGKGRIQHSSFFHHEQMRSSGTITVDKTGRITKVEMWSGHFLPTRENIPVIKKFLEKYIPAQYLTFDYVMPAAYIL